MKRLLKFGEKVTVEWIDACSQDEWTDRADIDLKPALVETSGLVYEHTKEYITIAGNHDPENDSFSCMMCVPSGMITKIKRLK